MSCECGLEKSFEKCCGPLLSGDVTATTAVELMRSRFVAFGLGNFDYIERTQVETLPAEIREGQAPEWESLEILETEDGGPEDESGVVEFVAFYKAGERRVHREVSRFVRLNSEWIYKDGDIIDESAEAWLSSKGP